MPAPARRSAGRPQTAPQPHLEPIASVPYLAPLPELSADRIDEISARCRAAGAVLAFAEAQRAPVHRDRPALGVQHDRTAFTIDAVEAALMKADHRTDPALFRIEHEYVLARRDLRCAGDHLPQAIHLAAGEAQLDLARAHAVDRLRHREVDECLDCLLLLVFPARLHRDDLADEDHVGLVAEVAEILR